METQRRKFQSRIDDPQSRFNQVHLADRTLAAPLTLRCATDAAILPDGLFERAPRSVRRRQGANRAGEVWEASVCVPESPVNGCPTGAHQTGSLGTGNSGLRTPPLEQTRACESRWLSSTQCHRMDVGSVTKTADLPRSSDWQTDPPQRALFFESCCSFTYRRLVKSICDSRCSPQTCVERMSQYRTRRLRSKERRVSLHTAEDDVRFLNLRCTKVVPYTNRWSCSTATVGPSHA